MSMLATARKTATTHNRKKHGLVGQARFVLKTSKGTQEIKSINSKERLLRTRVKPNCKNCKGGCKK
ncbi:MAG: hypothetical protein KAS32_28485 [Candidatus Peribacteraceae bacterium]|nr:hypothetical protein [Candidatus Peribacteraceae bacterium]